MKLARLILWVTGNPNVVGSSSEYRENVFVFTESIPFA